MNRLAGHVAIVTGAGQGIGRAEAMALALEGAKVVVNDLGDGANSPAEEVVAEIVSAGGEAIADRSDISDWDQVESMVARAVDELGGADILVCNAGFLRNNTTAGMTQDEWESILRVHLSGAFIPAHHIARHWQAQDEKDHQPSKRRRIVFTTSESGLLGNPAHGNYSAAKAGVAALTLCMARELAEVNATVNAVAPRARTRLNQHKVPAAGVWAPENVGSFVAHLCSLPDLSVTGQVFGVGAGAIDLYNGWTRVAHVDAFGPDWSANDLDKVMASLFEGRPSAPGDLSFMESMLSIGTGT